MAAARAEVVKWQKKEKEACHYLIQKLEDSMLTKLLRCPTVKQMWNILTEKFTALSTHIIADMWAKFDSMKCPNNGNVCIHLAELHTKYEELCGIGVILSDNEYSTHIIGPLSYHYQQYLSIVTSAAKAALFANNAARAAAAAATTASRNPTTSFTITLGSLATSQAISLDPAYIM
ncbi:hypothetical protein EDD85DRAFT_952845 [Armillaria nabsnona]|nr:hypothetical protein EDD85DRAFT_952845 [Armillaria nabsnona]